MGIIIEEDIFPDHKKKQAYLGAWGHRKGANACTPGFAKYIEIETDHYPINTQGNVSKLFFTAAIVHFTVIFQEKENKSAINPKS